MVPFHVGVSFQENLCCRRGISGDCMEPAPGKQDLKKETDVVNNEKKTNRNGNNKAPKQKGQDGVSHGHEYKYED